MFVPSIRVSLSALGAALVLLFYVSYQVREKRSETMTGTPTTTIALKSREPEYLVRTKEHYNDGGDLQCVDLHFSNVSLPVTALASFPGSGNTWVRHLIQQATGLNTGSIYCDRKLEANGFPGECIKHRDNRTLLVIKTHRGPNPKEHVFDRVVLLIRNPFDAIRSMFYHEGGHVGYPTKTDFRKGWMEHVGKFKNSWRNIALGWLNRFKGPTMIVRYENVVVNLKSEIARICKFLDIPVPAYRWECVMENSQGNFKRSRTSEKDQELRELATFPREVKEQLLKDMVEVDDATASFEFNDMKSS